GAHQVGERKTCVIPIAILDRIALTLLIALVMSSNKRISTDGASSFTQNPFAILKSDGLPPGPKVIPAKPSDRPVAEAAVQKKSRGRVDIIRQTAHRGGKTVTVIKGFVGIGLPEKLQLAKAMQKACGTGGTLKHGQ